MDKNDKKKIFVFLILFAFTSMNSIPALLIKMTNEDINNNDIPTWYEGDEWIYTADPVHYSGENGSFHGTIENLKNKVLRIADIMHDEVQYKVYEVEITGDIAGDFSFEELSGDLEGEITGTIFIRVSDLAQVKTEIFSEGVIEIYFIDLDYEADFASDFFPPLELYDFPLNIDEQWDISCTSISSGGFSLEGMINESYSGSQWINATMKCIEKENIDVPAGEFSCYKLNRTDNTVWYSPTVGNAVKSVINQSDENTTFYATLSLESFSRSVQPITILLDIVPYEAVPGETIVIYGQAIDSETGYNIANAPFLVEIPAANNSWSGYTNSSGEFVVTCKAPMITDGTPSPGEIGSVGVIAECFSDSLYGIKVKTLVIKENNPPDKPIIIGTNTGKIGEEYKYTFKATDPDGDDICYFVEWGDNTTNETEYVASGTEVTLKHTWDEMGDYTIKCKAKDLFDNESDWGTLEVTMPKNKQSTSTLFFQFLKKFIQHLPYFEWIISLFHY